MGELENEVLQPSGLVLKAMVPVYIVMDGGLVSKVVVDDEALKTSECKLVEPLESPELDQARLAHAIAMADDCEWPSWEFGW